MALKWHTVGRYILTSDDHYIAADVDEEYANLLKASPAMLDVLKLVAENEECVCECKRCEGPPGYHPSVFGHEYEPPAPCLGCQVGAVIKLAKGG